MKHPFFYKEIGQLSDELVHSLQEIVPTLTYRPDVDFYDHIITVAKLPAPFIVNILKEFSKYFRVNGHVSTSIALMQPMTYFHEHTDFYTKDPNNPLLNNNVVKLQIPIITNDKVGMMWQNLEPYINKNSNIANFKTGKIYIINNVDFHSIINLSEVPRYNLTIRFYKDSILDPTLIQ